MKRALVVGINYARDPRNKLDGCINDAKNIESTLRAKFGFSQVKSLIEEAATRTAILDAIAAEVSVAATQRVNELWFSFSGHGSQVRDTTGDEDDGYDETFISYDGGAITDDVIHALLARVPATTRVVVVFDSCHSGTMADLKYTYVAGTKTATESQKARAMSAHVVQISGCRDDQLSSDAFIDRQFTGALTSALLATLAEHDYDVTFFKLLSGMLKFLDARGFTQRPQITSSRPISCTSVFCTPASRQPMLTSV